jgi:hypothetical protein
MLTEWNLLPWLQKHETLGWLHTGISNKIGAILTLNFRKQKVNKLFESAVRWKEDGLQLTSTCFLVFFFFFFFCGAGDQTQGLGYAKQTTCSWGLPTSHKQWHASCLTILLSKTVSSPYLNPSLTTFSVIMQWISYYIPDQKNRILSPSKTLCKTVH